MTTTGFSMVETLPPEWEEYATWLRAIKDDRVADADFDIPGSDDLTPRVEFHRGGRMVAVAICRQVNRDEGLQAAWIGVPGFRADSIKFVVETHMTTQLFHEKYGRTPDPHELQHLCDDEGACDLGLTTDMLVCFDLERGGRFQQLGLPYHVNKTSKQVHWQGASLLDSNDKDLKVAGIVIDSLRRCFEEPLPADVAVKEGMSLDPADFGLSPERADLHMDMAVTRVMALAGFAVMYTGARDEEEAEIVKESMRRSGLHYGTSDGDMQEPDPDYSADRLDLMGTLLGAKLKAEREKVRQDELAETARRRAARGEPVPDWTKPESEEPKRPAASKRYTPPKS